MGSFRLRPLLGTIRFRITALATLVVAVVLTASASGLVVVQRQQLIANLDRSLDQRADTIAAAVASDGAAAGIGQSSDLDRAAQLVAGDGTVVAATPNLGGAGPLADPPDGGGSAGVGSGGEVRRTLDGLPLDDDRYRVLSRWVAAGDGPLVLHVVENHDDLDEAVRALTLALAIAIPVVVAVLAWLVWWLVGRTLRPVEAIRAEVAAITGTDPGRRVPVPDHGDEIAQLAATMNQMLDRVAAAAEHQRRFVADASHELRTPLTRMRTELEVDAGRPERADLAATHRRVLDEAIALQHLVDDLLFLARSDARATPSRAEAVDFDDVVFDEVERLAAGSLVAFDVRRVSAAQLSGDRDQLARAVRNLLANAARYAGTAVTVTLDGTGRSVVLVVADDGPGVPAEARDLIFERFGRASNARSTADGGAGLGLAIARDIVERHGGTLVIDPEATAGARFVATLPGLRQAPTDGRVENLDDASER